GGRQWSSGARAWVQSLRFTARECGSGTSCRRNERGRPPGPAPLEESSPQRMPGEVSARGGATSLRQLIAGRGREHVLVSLADTRVDAVTLHRGVTRVHADDHLVLSLLLLALFRTSGADVGGRLAVGQLSVDEGVGAELLHQVHVHGEGVI